MRDKQLEGEAGMKNWAAGLAALTGLLGVMVGAVAYAGSIESDPIDSRFSTQVDGSQKMVCTPEESMRAYTEASSLKNWDGVYESFKRFSHCNNENIVEAWGAFSEAVIRLLAHDWEHFDRFAALAKLNKEFERLVLKHIADQTISSDELEQVINNARMRCPSTSMQLCKEIEAVAK